MSMNQVSAMGFAVTSILVGVVAAYNHSQVLKGKLGQRDLERSSRKAMNAWAIAYALGAASIIFW